MPESDNQKTGKMSTENIPSVVRFNPEVVAYQSEEDQTEAPPVLEDANINHGDLGRDSNLNEDDGREDKNKVLQQDIVKYLRYKESKKYWTSNNSSFQESNGKGRSWNLVKKRFHENDVFFAKEAKVLMQPFYGKQNVMNHIL